MHYPWRRRRADGWLEQPSPACLFPAIAVEMKARVFLKAREKSDYGVQCVGCAHGYYLWARLRRWIGQWKKKCLDHGSDWKMESRLQRQNSDREESTVWSQNPRGKEMEDQSGRRSFRVKLIFHSNTGGHVLTPFFGMCQFVETSPCVISHLSNAILLSFDIALSLETWVRLMRSRCLSSIVHWCLSLLS